MSLFVSLKISIEIICCLPSLSLNNFTVRTKVEKLVKNKFADLLSDVRKTTSTVTQWHWTNRHEPVPTTTSTSNAVVVNEESFLDSDEEERVVLNPIYEDCAPPPFEKEESGSELKSNIFKLPNVSSGLDTHRVSLSEICGKFLDKTKKMDIKKLLQHKGLVRQEGMCASTIEESDSSIEQNPPPVPLLANNDLEEESKDEFSVDNNSCLQQEYGIQFHFDEDGESKKIDETTTTRNVHRQRMCMGDIGRSVSENPNAEDRETTSNSKRLALTDIGRSFSVATAAADEEIVGIFIEGTSSCPNPSSLHASSTLSTGNSNHRLAAISVPVSPIGKLRVVDNPHRPSESINTFRNSKKFLLRDSSFQSDSSHCSSVESLLEARKPDPEAILINLGFGPPRTEDILSKIPKRQEKLLLV